MFVILTEVFYILVVNRRPRREQLIGHRLFKKQVNMYELVVYASCVGVVIFMDLIYALDSWILGSLFILGVEFRSKKHMETMMV